MKRQLKKTIAILLTVCFLLPITAVAVSAKEGNPNPGVSPLNSNSYGKTYGEWSEEWWKWVLSIPADHNPLIDPDGSFCAESQSGKVWFLAGSWVGPVERSCMIPAGKAIFFPIVNVVAYEEPGMEWSEEENRALAKEYINSVTLLEVTVDDKSLKDLYSYRVGSDQFVFTPVEGNILGLPVSPYSLRAVSDGYWIMLTPLSKGVHTIRIHGVIGENSYETDVTYHITVT